MLRHRNSHGRLQTPLDVQADGQKLQIGAYSKHSVTGRKIKIEWAIFPKISMENNRSLNKSLLLLTVPHNAVTHAHRVVHRCQCSVRWTGDRDHHQFMTLTADRPSKLTAPETISRSRDMVGAHQNLNGSRDPTTPFSGTVCHPSLCGGPARLKST